jgi:hypothetical protein
MKTTKSLLAIALCGLVILSAAGCAKGPIPNSTLYAYGDEKDPSNKAIATDPRNKMAAKR